MNKKILIGLGIGITAIAVGIGIKKYLSKNDDKKTLPPITPPNNDSTLRGEKKKEDSIFPLKKGSIGEEVRVVQQYLNRSSSCKEKVPKPTPNSRIIMLLPLEENGIFDDKTEMVLDICYKTSSINEETFSKIRAGLDKMTEDK